MKRGIISVLVLILYPIFINAQLVSDFDDGTTQGWLQEGDGDAVHWATGFSGGALRVNDDATGDQNYAIAPLNHLGDWSAATSSDSRTLVYYYDRFDGTLNPTIPYLIQISGPGGKARALCPSRMPSVGAL